MLYEKVRDLAALKHVSLAEIERCTGLSDGAISKWRKSYLSALVLKRVAKYLNVSMDYLMQDEE